MSAKKRVIFCNKFLIYCSKLQKEALGLEKPPMPGELGEKIYNHISKEAWGLWLKHQTILINEHRLKMNEPQSRAFLMKEMKNFLFGEDR